MHKRACACAQADLRVCRCVCACVCDWVLICCVCMCFSMCIILTRCARWSACANVCISGHSCVHPCMQVCGSVPVEVQTIITNMLSLFLQSGVVRFLTQIRTFIPTFSGLIPTTGTNLRFALRIVASWSCRIPPVATPTYLPPRAPVPLSLVVTP